MSIRELLFGKKKEPTPAELQATVAPTAVDHGEERPVEHPNVIRYPVNKGDFFPLNGFMFQVTNVNQHGFTCQVTGVTKKMQKKFDAYKAKKQEEKLR